MQRTWFCALHNQPYSNQSNQVRQRQDHPVYAGMVEAMDGAVGTVLRAVERAPGGAAGRTVTIYTSDNGGVSSGDAFATANLPLRGGKGRHWEGCERGERARERARERERERERDPLTHSPIHSLTRAARRHAACRAGGMCVTHCHHHLRCCRPSG
eukprot:SAG22_NODE_3068_length_1967_cov_42.783726_3_plen_156_part_00